MRAIDCLPTEPKCETIRKGQNEKRRRYRKSAITGSNQVEMVVYL